MIELALSKYEQWLKSEGDTFQSTLYEKIVRELMTLGESGGPSLLSVALFKYPSDSSMWKDACESFGVAMNGQSFVAHARIRRDALIGASDIERGATALESSMVVYLSLEWGIDSQIMHGAGCSLFKRRPSLKLEPFSALTDMNGFCTHR